MSNVRWTYATSARSIKPVTNHVPAPLPPAAAQQASSQSAGVDTGANQ